MYKLIFILGRCFRKLRLNEKKFQKILSFFSIIMLALLVLSYIFIFNNKLSPLLALLSTAVFFCFFSICYEIIGIKPYMHYIILIVKIILFSVLFIFSIILSIQAKNSNAFFNSICVVFISGDRVSSYIKKLITDSEYFLKERLGDIVSDDSLKKEINADESLKRIKDKMKRL